MWHELQVAVALAAPKIVDHGLDIHARLHMQHELLVALALGTSNIVVHAIGTYAMLQWMLSEIECRNFLARWRTVWTLLRFLLALVVLHSFEIAMWGQFYRWQGCFPDDETAWYYSLTSYTTVGYGDGVIANPWRLMGGLEAMFGVLLFAWSTAALVTLLTYIQNAHVKRRFGHIPE